MKKLKLLIYGPAGHGKTTILKTAVGDDRLMPALLVDFEGGVADSIGSVCLPIENILQLKNLKPESSKIYVFRVKQWDDFQAIYDVFDESMFKSVFIDSLSEINFMNLMTLVNTSVLKRPIIKDMKMPKINNYGDSAYQMNVLIRAFRDFDVNLVCTAGVMRKESKITGSEKLYPSMVGQLTEKVGSIFSIVGYLGIHPGDDDIEKGTRVLITHASEDYEAKFRDEERVVEDSILNPTLPLLLNLLNGDLSGKD